MDLQAFFNAMGEASRDTRSKYHLTLSALTEKLEAADPEMIVKTSGGLSPVNAHSYRGYYSDLSFEASDEPATVAELLAECRNANGETFEGYKGGDFKMGDDTPLWLASYGCCGEAMTDAEVRDGVFVIVTKQID